MTGLLAPADVWVSATWWDHKSRNPPSSEPGTDYATAYGTAVRAAERGTVIDVNWSNGGGTGRYVTVALDTGETIRYLHLSSIWVEVGWAVDRGQGIAATGASGFGSDWGYDPHVHVTLWRGAIWAEPTIDFQTRIGPGNPPPEEPDMPLTEEEISKIASRAASSVWNYSMGGAASDDDPDAVPTETGGERLRNIRRATNGVKGRTERIEDDTEQLTATPPATHPLSGPAWTVGVFLGLIGLVELVRFIVDLVV